jgi:hypothetical protein
MEAHHGSIRNSLPGRDSGLFVIAPLHGSPKWCKELSVYLHNSSSAAIPIRETRVPSYKTESIVRELVKLLVVLRQ